MNLGNWFLLLAFGIHSSCSPQKPTQTPPERPPNNPIPWQESPRPCEVLKTTVFRSYRCKSPCQSWSDRISLPASGTFYVESHLATTEDSFNNERPFPSHEFENIDDHLDRSALLLQKTRAELYRTHWERKWTPPEGGRAGQGSAGQRKPSPWNEMFVFNMMFDKRSQPKPGEKWLMGKDGLFVVVVGGYERGPGIRDRLGGVQAEVHAILKTHSQNKITLYGPLLDQDVLAGPIDCSDVSVIDN